MSHHGKDRRVLYGPHFTKWNSNPLLRNKPRSRRPPAVNPIGQSLLPTEELGGVATDARWTMNRVELELRLFVLSVVMGEPQLDLGGIDLDMELEPQMRPNPKGLIRATLIRGEALRSGWEIERFVVPMKNIVRRLLTEPCAAQWGVNALHAMPAHFGGW